MRRLLSAALLLLPGLAAAQLEAGWERRQVAKLQVLDKVTARVSVISVPVDEPARFGTLTIRVGACYARPPDEVPDSASWMEIRDSRGAAAAERQMVFRGWMFAEAPGAHMLEHPVYDLRVLECLEG